MNAETTIQTDDMRATTLRALLECQERDAHTWVGALPRDVLDELVTMGLVVVVSRCVDCVAVTPTGRALIPLAETYPPPPPHEQSPHA